MPNHKICILGASGFIGRNLHAAIRRHNDLGNTSIVLVDLSPVDQPGSHPEDHFISVNSNSDLLAETLKETTICINLASKIFLEKTNPEEMVSILLEASLSPIHVIQSFLPDFLI